MIHPDADPHTPAPPDLARRQAAIFDAEGAGSQVSAIVAKRDAQRAGEIAGAAAEFRRCERRRRPCGSARAAAAHQRFPFERFWMGGVQFGHPLRGYEETTVTPLGYIPECTSRTASCPPTPW